MVETKLFIRSEVLSVIHCLTAVSNPSRHDRAKEVRRLAALEPRQVVIEVLLKEFQRSRHPSTLQIISELLMEVGNIHALQEPLWSMIRDPQVLDEVKDCANLILHHLGDEADPDLYLDYLEDPQGVIFRETERMLEVSAQNPEALIDFIDFIFALPEGEQLNLIASLQSDYPAQAVMNLYEPILLSRPPEPLRDLILRGLGQVRSPENVLFLNQMLRYFEEQEVPHRLVKKAIAELRLAGLYKEDNLEGYRALASMALELPVHSAHATLPDGLGNQGLLITRRWANNDLMLLCVALNDIHGVMDCFGFYQISQEDYERIFEKFYEEGTKVSVSSAYVRLKLLSAENLNLNRRTRLPYEYVCWRKMFTDIEPLSPNFLPFAYERGCPEWSDQTAYLYQHPDFSPWFLEENDWPDGTAVLNEALAYGQQLIVSHPDLGDFLGKMQAYEHHLLISLFHSEWRQKLITRLAEAAYLLEKQGAETFSKLAATEAVVLSETLQPEKLPEEGFFRRYVRRCLEELLLRLYYPPGNLTSLRPYTETLLAAWSDP
jgi:hypothetical protein